MYLYVYIVICDILNKYMYTYYILNCASNWNRLLHSSGKLLKTK